MTALDGQGKRLQYWKKPYVFVLALAVIAGAVYFGFRYFPEKTKTQKPVPLEKPSPAGQQADTVVWQGVVDTAAFKRRFRLKRTTDLLGLHVLYLESRRVPQQVIIAENVPQNSSAVLFGENPDLVLMTMVSNQLLALRKKKNAQRLLVDRIDAVSAEPLLLNGHRLQHRKIKVTIRFESEKKSRHYVASLLKYSSSRPETTPAGKAPVPIETVLVAFAKPESFDSGILPELLALNPQFVSPEKNGQAVNAAVNPKRR